MTNVAAVIFDMDGVLIDSEPFWQEAEQDAFRDVGVELTHDDMTQTVGLRIDEVAQYWMARRPWNGTSPENVAANVLEGVIARVHQRGAPMPGVRSSLAVLRQRGLPLALASSSARRLIDAVVDTLGLGPFDAVASAEDEDYGKPHPAVFLSAANALGVHPERCLAVEDSLNGVVAAKAARMSCLAVPDPRLQDDPRFVLADAVAASLADVDWTDWLKS